MFVIELKDRSGKIVVVRRRSLEEAVSVFLNVVRDKFQLYRG